MKLYISRLFLPTLLTPLVNGLCPYATQPNGNTPPNDEIHRQNLRTGRRLNDDTSDFSATTTMTEQSHRRVSTTSSCWTIENYDILYDEIETQANLIGDDGERGHFFGGIVRLAAHDFMDGNVYDANNIGGSDGCLDFTNSANAGLDDIWCTDADDCPLYDIYNTSYSWSSRADFWVAAAGVVIDITSSNAVQLPFRWGRTDSDSCTESSDRLPGDSGCSEVERTFITQMGLTWRDATALMGAHTLGRGSVDFSGHEGTWVNGDDESCVFDKLYYRELIDRSWFPNFADAGTDWTWGADDSGFMMLNTDICLVYDIPDGDDQTCCTDTNTTRRACTRLDQCEDASVVRQEAYEAVIEFANEGSSSSPFFEAFQESWVKAVENGYADNNLYDLSTLDSDCVERNRTDAPNIIIMQPDDFLFFNAWTPPPGGAGGDFITSTYGLPNLEKLRTQGLQMMQAYTASPKCGTSRYSTMTGRYPSRSAYSRDQNAGLNIVDVSIQNTKIDDVNGEMDCSDDNLAMLFQRNDYRTGFFGKWHLKRVTSFTEDDYEDHQDEILACGFDVADGIYMENLDSYDNQTHNLEWITSLAIDFINDDTTYGDKPFFMYFNPTVPHSSGDVSDALESGTCTETTNGTQPEPLIPGMNADYGTDGSCSAYRQSVIARAGDSDKDRELGAVWVDDSVGALLTALESKGELNNTIFLFQQDHGMGDKGDVYEGGTRIAQFVYYPDGFGTEGKTFDGMVSTIDIGPTMLDFANVTSVSPGWYEMDGVSWKDAIDDENEATWFTEERCLLFEHESDRAVRCTCEKYSNVSGVLSYHNLCDSNGNYINYDADDTDNDPEDIDLSNDYPDRVDVMSDVFECYESKTMPDLERDFTINDCNDDFVPNPTAAPSPAPTPFPTVSSNPTYECTDHDGRFEIDGGATRHCEWVSSNPTTRCLSYGCYCRTTCGLCDKDCDHFTSDVCGCSDTS